MKTILVATGERHTAIEPMLDGLKSLSTYRPVPYVYGAGIPASEESPPPMAALVRHADDAIEVAKPCIVLVEGDSDFVVTLALAAMRAGIPVARIGAGWRSGRLESNWEKNRRLLDAIAYWHFAPSYWASEQLRRENIPDDSIFVSGSPFADLVRGRSKDNIVPDSDSIGKRLLYVVLGQRYAGYAIQHNVHDLLVSLSSSDVLVTVEAQESLPSNTHLERIRRASLVITDDEVCTVEAVTLGRPVVVFGIDCCIQDAVVKGAAIYAEQDVQQILAVAQATLDGTFKYTPAPSLYGDGYAAHAIAKILGYANTNYWDAHPAIFQDGSFKKWTGEGLGIGWIAQYLREYQSIADIGAGQCLLLTYLKSLGWEGEYTPIDYGEHAWFAANQLGLTRYQHKDVTEGWSSLVRPQAVVIRHVLEHSRYWANVVEQATDSAQQVIVISLFLWKSRGKTDINLTHPANLLYHNAISLEELDEILGARGWRLEQSVSIGRDDLVRVYIANRTADCRDGKVY